MKQPNTATWIGVAVLFGVLAGAMPAQAQFGSGVVYDPTQSVHAIKQIYNETQQIAQGSQAQLTRQQQLLQDIKLVSQTLSIYNQEVSTYNTIYNNLIHFNSKQIWKTAENALMAASVENTHGETSGLQAQLNGQSQNASMVWKIMNLALNGTSSSFWARQTVGASERLSTLAHIEAMDAAGTTCLGAVGAYNAGRTANLAANNALGTSQFDVTAFTNSELEQLNLINASNAQRMQEEHAQGQIQACMAAQAAVVNMDKRNAASVALNDAAYRDSQQASNPTYAGGESRTWTTYY